MIINKVKQWVSLTKPVLLLFGINSINHLFRPADEQLYYLKYLFLRDEVTTYSMISELCPLMVTAVHTTGGNTPSLVTFIKIMGFLNIHKAPPALSKS